MAPRTNNVGPYARVPDYTTPYGVTARETALQDPDMNSMTQFTPSRRLSDIIAYFVYAFKDSMTRRKDSGHDGKDSGYAGASNNPDWPEDALANKARRDLFANEARNGSCSPKGVSATRASVAAVVESHGSPTSITPLTRRPNPTATPPQEFAAPSHRPSNADAQLEVKLIAAFRKAEARGDLSDASREREIKRLGIYRSASDSKCTKASRKFSRGCLKQKTREQRKFEKLMKKENGEGWRARLRLGGKKGEEDGEALVGESDGVSPTDGEKGEQDIETDEDVTMGEVGEAAGPALRQCQTVI